MAGFDLNVDGFMAESELQAQTFGEIAKTIIDWFGGRARKKVILTRRHGLSPDEVFQFTVVSGTVVPTEGAINIVVPSKRGKTTFGYDLNDRARVDRGSLYIHTIVDNKHHMFDRYDVLRSQKRKLANKSRPKKKPQSKK